MARVFVLRDVQLAELTARRTLSFADAIPDTFEKSAIRVEDEATGEVLEGGRSLFVHVQFRVSLRHDENAILEVAGTFDLRYERQFEDAEVSGEDIQLFSRINGVYNCWPYMREVVASTFARLGYPPYTLDSLVIAPEPDKSQVPAST